MRVARNLFMVLIALALVIACASTPKGRYYQNLDMYVFVMDQVKATYKAAPVAEQAQMDRELLPLLKGWSSARKAWKLSLNDATKEQAAMLAWSEARSALLNFGIVTVKQLEEVGEVQ